MISNQCDVGFHTSCRTKGCECFCHTKIKGNKMKKNHIKKLKETTDFKFLVYKLLIEQWNAETPHFNGCGPHRYNGSEKYCCYCNRPKDWSKANNPGMLAGELEAGDAC